MFMNFRSDRARQLTQAFVSDQFNEFPQKQHPHLGRFVSLTEYADYLPTQIAFPPERLKNGLGEIISHLGLHQLRIAETEKYAHVTF
ncbi:2,3-bisphosphoglycerate-independent phosphoglycerate mutase, partial [Acinetobacter baumannii]